MNIAYIVPNRSLYRKADVYLLDDPLSAVDSKVGSEMLQR